MKISCPKFVIPIFLGATLVVSCSKKEKLSRDKMVNVLHDLQLAEALYQNRYRNFNELDNKTALFEGILSKHGITQAELDSSLVWYADHPEEYIRINDSVNARIKRELKTIESNLPNNDKKNKYNNAILPYYTYVTEGQSFLDFYIDSIAVKDYKKFELSLKSLGVQKNIEAEIDVHFEYKDTVITKSQVLSKDGFIKIDNPQFNDTIKSISGFIYTNSYSMKDYNVLLYDIKLKGDKELVTTNSKDSIK